MLVDSDVLIWHFRGLPRATQRLDRLLRLTISAATYFELLQGMRNRAELLVVQKILARRNTERLPLTQAITERAAATCPGLGTRSGQQDRLRSAMCHAPNRQRG